MKILMLLVFSVMAAGPGKKAKDANLNFDGQVVEGEVYRPEYSVVTGEAPGEGWGVLRLRTDFKDHAQTDRLEQESRR